ncbi:hypothetical protein MRB53_039232 [Persea americana]|nr:hypothetical protein MRB53_039232 [Persea americana]
MRYADDIVLRFNVTTEYEAVMLREAVNTLFVDLWDATNEFIDVRLSKDMYEPFIGLLPDTLRTAHILLMSGTELVHAVSDSHSPPQDTDTFAEPLSPSSQHSKHKSKSSSSVDLFFREYRPLSAIMPWMKLMESLFPEHVEMVSIGHTFEGRDLPGLRISSRLDDATTLAEARKTIIVAGGLHAREWISTSSVNFVAYSFITAYKAGKQPLVNDFDWLFVPTLNPDGYAYTWEWDRLWRKNRQDTKYPFCKGIDLDKTWDFQWDNASIEDNPCSESYAGSLHSRASKLSNLPIGSATRPSTITSSSSGSWICTRTLSKSFIPYSYTCNNKPPTLEDLEELAEGLSKAIRLENHETYKIKLRDKGSYGFLLPPKYIVPTGKEVLRAVEYYGRALASGLFRTVSDPHVAPASFAEQAPLE